MSEDQFKPGINDCGSDHYIDSTLNEISRLGTKPDEDFLSRVSDELIAMEANSVVPTINPDKKRLIQKLAAAAALVLIVSLTLYWRKVDTSVSESETEIEPTPAVVDLVHQSTPEAVEVVAPKAIPFPDPGRPRPSHRQTAQRFLLCVPQSNYQGGRPAA